MEWIKHDKGVAVNLYTMGKMLDTTAAEMKGIMLASFDADKMFLPYRGMTFAEYVNEKRQFTASVMGMPQYY